VATRQGALELARGQSSRGQAGGSCSTIGRASPPRLCPQG
jgi:hypothetical protein